MYVDNLAFTDEEILKIEQQAASTVRETPNSAPSTSAVNTRNILHTNFEDTDEEDKVIEEVEKGKAENTNLLETKEKKLLEK